MKKTYRYWMFAAAALVSLQAPVAEAAVDPYIAWMAADVDRAEVERIIQTLQDFGTRNTFTPECALAADWVLNEMAGSGLSPFYESFTVKPQQESELD